MRFRQTNADFLGRAILNDSVEAFAFAGLAGEVGRGVDERYDRFALLADGVKLFAGHGDRDLIRYRSLLGKQHGSDGGIGHNDRRE